MKTPSPATAIATIALVVAATGTAGAAGGWINGSRIKPHSITAKQIKNHAITKASLAGPLAASVADPTIGTTGATGPAGPAGAPGLLDPSKMLVVPGTDVSLTASTDGVATAACPAGSFLIGGGYSDMGTAQKVYAISSGPAADGSQAWLVHARNESTLSQSQPWHAIAYCVVSP